MNIKQVASEIVSAYTTPGCTMRRLRPLLDRLVEAHQRPQGKPRDTRRDAVAELIREGLPTSQICERLGVSVGLVGKIRNELGLSKPRKARDE